MNRIRNLRAGIAALALVAAAGGSPAFAQTEIVAAPNPDADALQTQIRVLAESPRDVDALLAAGQLSTRMGDTSAALAFFQRAEAVEPSNPRILSGRASALVRLERPGEALRLFQEAEARGVSPREYASDRGFAYDLLGSPEMAQRDYKLALSQRRDDETIRRYALSLGITGDTEEAMKQLDTLLRGGDRASWRARAFIMAMNGDAAGAERIAASMMPGSMGASLTPFFRRLAGLSPADRAFAVHFGEMSPTQARLADARMAPAVPRYVPQGRPVQVAQAQPAATPPAVTPKGNDRRSRRDRIDAPQPTPMPAPVRTAEAAPLPSPPAYVQRQAPMVQPVPSTPEPTPAPARPVQFASSGVRMTERAVPAPRTDMPARTPEPVTRAAVAASMPAAPSEAPPPAEESRPAPAETRPPSAPVRRVGAEDSVLASIVANITIPADELEAANRPVEAAPEPASQPALAVAPEPARPVPKPVAKPKPEAPKVEAPKPDAKAAAAKPGTAKGKADAAKLDPKAKKPDPKKPDPKKPDPAKAEPKRVWVQVAGGANVDSLPKAWKATVAKAPAAFKGRAGWWTPLRATNRVLTGPFKTAAEAQTFVNSLGKSGVSGFVFTSDAGQKVTKLGAQ
ncbi:SPOR domain-containing protein [Sphingomonas sp. JC676]|uniref:SPOR domain-containing protein n=1 Tax=Sphingomonas sp. JC676 TaxID=2768065 RepID=UPI001657D852|nr:SPOR domain-containing protein [Sphingomonas sp. JC676]MBC9032357.1 SPOR domain-containing protein [Sphingomonas sp. JC676]